MKVEGGCHCGLVRYEATVPDGPLQVDACDCSICSMTDYLHLIVPDADFRLLEGRKETTTYRFGSGTAQHIFCAQCGIESFHKPRSNPRAISLNLRCLDDWRELEAVVRRPDGAPPPA